MKICIVKTDRMGDMILTLPAIEAIKKDENNIVHVVSSIKNFKIASAFSLIDKSFLYKPSLKQFILLILKLRKEKYDIIYNFTPYKSSFFLAYFSKSKLKSIVIHLSRSKKILSKVFIRVLASIFFDRKFVVNRLKCVSKFENFHQTNIMFKVIKSDLSQIKETGRIKFFLKNEQNLNFFNNSILIHLSSRWLHKKYSEENLLYLIEKLLKRKLKIFLTTDESTKNRFPKIFKLYKKIDFKFIKSSYLNEEILIINNLNFQQLSELTNKVENVLTPECGLVHIAGMCECKLIVVYNGYYFPKMIMHEYAPWKKKYYQLISTQENLNKHIIELI